MAKTQIITIIIKKKNHIQCLKFEIIHAYEFLNQPIFDK